MMYKLYKFFVVGIIFFCSALKAQHPLIEILLTKEHTKTRIRVTRQTPFDFHDGAK